MVGDFLIKRTLILALVALAAALGLASCGGGSDNGEKSEPAARAGTEGITIPFWDNGPREISKTQYLKRANAVCQEGRDQMPESFGGRFRNVSHGKLYDEATSDIFLPGVQLWFDDVAYIGAPPGDKPQVEALLIAMQRAVYKSEKAQPILFSGDLIGEFAESNRLVRAYGLRSCLVEGAPFQPR
jgi:hypothetical protein